jgi:chemotaxis protein MotA
MARTQASRAVPRDSSSLRPESRIRLDPATLLGFASGFGLVAAAMFISGSLKSFVDLPAFFIVVGGTLGVTTICFSMPEIIDAYKALIRTVASPSTDPGRAATTMLQLAELSRQKGLMAVEDEITPATHDRFARRALTMALDGLPGEEIETVMRRDILAMQERHATNSGVFRKAAEVAPAMGLIGTLIGLVQMLGNLDDPASIGPNMAIALLTTFYGAILSTMVFSPLASKLERNSADETLISRIYMLGAASIGRKENPRRLETMINALLPPAKRIQYFA